MCDYFHITMSPMIREGLGGDGGGTRILTFTTQLVHIIYADFICHFRCMTASTSHSVLPRWGWRWGQYWHLHHMQLVHVIATIPLFTILYVQLFSRHTDCYYQGGGGDNIDMYTMQLKHVITTIPLFTILDIQLLSRHMEVCYQGGDGGTILTCPCNYTSLLHCLYLLL